MVPPIIVVGENSIDGLGLNSIILLVLAARSIFDYYVGWKSLYNRLQKKPEEIIRLSSFLENKNIISPHDSKYLRKLVAEKLMPLRD